MGATKDQTFCACDTSVQHGVLQRVNTQLMQTSAAVCGRESTSVEASLSATTVGLMRLHGNRGQPTSYINIEKEKYNSFHIHS